jgi:hypothetical protein
MLTENASDEKSVASRSGRKAKPRGFFDPIRSGGSRTQMSWVSAPCAADCDGGFEDVTRMHEGLIRGADRDDPVGDRPVET